MMKKYCFAILMMATSSSLWAGLYINPYYYQTATGEIDEKKVPTGSEASAYDSETMVYGARLGWSWADKYLVGLEYSISEIEMTLTGTQSLIDTQNAAGEGAVDKWDGQHYGIWVANKYMKRWFGWIGGGLSFFEDTNTSSPITKGDEYKGFYWLFGMGYAIGGLVQISAEYRRHTLTHYTPISTGVGVTLPNETLNLGEFDVKELFLGISLSIDIGK